MIAELFNPNPWIERGDISQLPQVIFGSDTSYIFLNDQLNDGRKKEITTQLNQFLEKSNVVTEPSLLIPTSGTTSHRLKIVVQKKSHFLNAAKKVNSFLKSQSGDTWLVSLPLHHVAGLSILGRAYLNKNKTYYWTKWEPATFIKNLNQWHINYCSLVPTQIFDLIQQNTPAPNHLKTVLVGGSALPDSHWQAMLQLGWPLLKTFGMTETAALISTSSTTSKYYDPLPGVEVNLDSSEHLAIKSTSLFAGYIVERGTATTTTWQFQPIQQNNGFWSSEDRAILNGQQFEILGRDQGIIKIKGELVNTQILNQKLTELSSETMSAANTPILHFVPNERDEHELFAIFPKIENELIQKNVIKRFNQLVLPYERINWYIVMDEIPRTDLGKIKISALNAGSFKETYFENRQSIL